MSEIKLRDFEGQILFFNGMYGLPIAPFPSTGTVANDVKQKNPIIENDREAVHKRLTDFKNILTEELNEIDEVVDGLKNQSEIEALTSLADLFGDIIVYCASEMAKYGIPYKETMNIIMSSNFSKLDINQRPIYDERGKLLKGPAYWAPEPKLKQMLQERITDAVGNLKDGIVWREDK